MKPFHRRELLQLFSAGAIIAPVVGKEIVPNAEARLLAEPLIELVDHKILPYSRTHVKLKNVFGIAIVLTDDDGNGSVITSWTTGIGEGAVRFGKGLRGELRLWEENLGTSPSSFFSKPTGVINFMAGLKDGLPGK